jgi:hypothetical protein
LDGKGFYQLLILAGHESPIKQGVSVPLVPGNFRSFPAICTPPFAVITGRAIVSRVHAGPLVKEADNLV